METDKDFVYRILFQFGFQMAKKEYDEYNGMPLEKAKEYGRTDYLADGRIKPEWIIDSVNAGAQVGEAFEWGSPGDYMDFDTEDECERMHNLYVGDFFDWNTILKIADKGAIAFVKQQYPDLSEQIAKKYDE